MVIKANSVVLLGNFNPAIFSPSWVLTNVDLLDDEDTEVKLIHSEIADFKMSDVRFTIERNRVIINSLSHDVELIVAIAMKMFDDILVHTPLWAYGVNFEKHVDFQTFRKRNELGRVLCPLDPWGDWANDFDNEDPKLNGGMSSVSMKKIVSREPEIFHIFTIEPSHQKDMESSGVFFKMNNHFGDKSKMDVNDEEFRKDLFISLRGKVIEYRETFEKIVEHFKQVGGVDE